MFGFPVKVYKATDEPTEGVSFRQIHAACNHRVTQPKRCDHCNTTVSNSDVVKGVEHGDGFLTFTDDEIKALKPEAAGTIKIEGYLAADAIDPTYQDGAVYFIAPDRGDKKKADCDTYTTWRDALQGRWAVGRVVMSGREHVVALRAVDRLLTMHYIRTHAEIRSVHDVPGYVDVPETSKREYQELMAQLIDKSTIAFDDVAIEADSYVMAVQSLIEARRAGQPNPTQPEAAQVSTGVDLMAMLQASLAAKG
jgi:Ku protein